MGARDLDHVTTLQFWDPPLVFGRGEARQFEFGT